MNTGQLLEAVKPHLGSLTQMQLNDVIFKFTGDDSGYRIVANEFVNDNGDKAPPSCQLLTDNGNASMLESCSWRPPEVKTAAMSDVVEVSEGEPQEKEETQDSGLPTQGVPEV